ncbi:MAG: response regulator [Bacteroidota bacterium]
MMNNDIDTFSLFMVDDDDDDLELMKSAFTEIGFPSPIQCFNEGQELLNYLLKRDSQEPTLILLDLNMPKNNGKTILNKIRQNPDFKNAVIIIYSTSNSKSDILEAYQLGCNAYVIKPNCYTEIIKIASGIKKLWFDANNVLKIPREVALV